LSLSACAVSSGTAVWDQAPVFNELFDGDYTLVASCVFTVLDSDRGKVLGLRKTDLPDTLSVSIVAMPSGFRMYEFLFSKEGAKTRVKYTEVQNIWDRHDGTEKRGIVSRCAQRTRESPLR
jgi:hypothetical protein